MSQPPPRNITNNLLSNVNPPSELPSFFAPAVPSPQPVRIEAPNIPQPTVPVPFAATAQSVAAVPLDSDVPNVAPIPMYTVGNTSGGVSGPDQIFVPQPQADPYLQTTFNPAVAPNPLPNLDSSQPVQSPINVDQSFSNLYLNPNSISAALDPIAQSSSNLLGWVKGAAVGTGGILQKVAEKAKSSVDTLVTTLDPQMKEYLLSGGDVEILIASDKDDKVRPIREAFQITFGRATLTGFSAQPKSIATQPVGFQNALIAAQERIINLRESAGPGANLPVIALENFIVELFPDQWFDAGLLVISDVLQNFELYNVTQMTPIPLSVIATIKAETPDSYEFKNSGFAVTVGQVMSNSLQVHHSEWHVAYTTVRRSDMILSAAKTLAAVYKQRLVLEIPLQ